MTKKIFRSMLSVVVITLLISLLTTTVALYGYFAGLQKNMLQTQAALAAGGVNENGISYFSSELPSNYRYTLISPEGLVLYDSNANFEEMENHLGRKEIQEALQNGTGNDVRYSSTLSVTTFYHAIRLGSGDVLRVSVTQNTVFAMIGEVLPLLLLAFALCTLAALFVARHLSGRVCAPINNIDLEHPLDNHTYEELSPLLLRIDRQRGQIDRQLRELQDKRQEWDAITKHMSEGLLLLGQDDVILSINEAAAHILGTDASCVGQNLLLIDRSRAMQQLLTSARTGGLADMTSARLGRDYRFRASAIRSDGRVLGLFILIFDITAQNRAEQLRREFTANVSHELKTPLQTILGSAELLESGLVKAADTSSFIKKIRTEAARLVSLIDDTIRLSQLDEGIEPGKEEVPLIAIAKEVVEALETKALEKHVMCRVSGPDVSIMGVRRLIYEIIYNLCDNAIKYNKEGGLVDIHISAEKDYVSLTVSDTGIGIPSDSKDRVFERFYRVDKSHSRATGGTGLGLSIVKHAAGLHQAEITLESELGRGTTIALRFPAEAKAPHDSK